MSRVQEQSNKKRIQTHRSFKVSVSMVDKIGQLSSACSWRS
jgi:hypothetical protein